MKKILFSIVTTVVLATCMASCGGKKSDNENSTVNVEKDTVTERSKYIPFLSALPIEGEDASYFKVYSEYFTDNVDIIGTPDPENPEKGIIRAKVKLKVKEQFKDLKDFGTIPPMALYFLNEDKETISSLRLEMSDTDQEIILAELRKPKPGTVDVTYKGDYYADSYNKIFDQAEFLQIQGADLRDNSESDSSSSSGYSSDDDSDESSSYSSASSSSEDWDDILDSYEEYVNEYIALMKKVSQGDASAMAKYPELLEKAQEYGDKLANAKSAMSSAQIARYSKITTKLTKVSM
ncbi:MAG: hypothetical protein K2L89_04585 [Muribaculaceae bacterium]|nr:hypothetical protein [Muribaculaceae bacterium]